MIILDEPEFHIQNADAPIALVTVIHADGSTPREIGARMLVSATSISGTVGGGALEEDAIVAARKLIQNSAGSNEWIREEKKYPLGPSLGQCCGGYVQLLFERFGVGQINPFLTDAGNLERLVRPVLSGEPPLIFDNVGHTNNFHSKRLAADHMAEGRLLSIENSGDMWFIDTSQKPALTVYLYGAGHVARKLVHQIGELQMRCVWVDDAVSRFPETLPHNVHRLVLEQPARAARTAPDDAVHIVMTYSHAIDLEICKAVIDHGTYQQLGVIGSQTKRHRFEKRLRELGCDERAIKAMVCPIGSSAVTGKSPAHVALSVAVELVSLVDKADAVSSAPSTVRPL